MGQSIDSLDRVRNDHEPSFRSVVMSMCSIANRAAEPVETPNMCKYTISDGCLSSTVNFDADTGDGYCVRNVPLISWVMYAL